MKNWKHQNQIYIDFQLPTYTSHIEIKESTPPPKNICEETAEKQQDYNVKRKIYPPLKSDGTPE